MLTPNAPDALVRFDLILDHAQWQELEREALRRDCDPGALLSFLLTQQLHRP